MKRDELEKLYEADVDAYARFMKEYESKLRERCVKFYESIDFKELENWIRDTFKVNINLTPKYYIMERWIKITSQVLNPSDIPLLSFMVKDIWFHGRGGKLRK